MKFDDADEEKSDSSNGLKEEYEPWRCLECEVNFTSKLYLFNHLLHHIKQPFVKLDRLQPVNPPLKITLKNRSGNSFEIVSPVTSPESSDPGWTPNSLDEGVKDEQHSSDDESVHSLADEEDIPQTEDAHTKEESEVNDEQDQADQDPFEGLDGDENNSDSEESNPKTIDTKIPPEEETDEPCNVSFSPDLASVIGGAFLADIDSPISFEEGLNTGAEEAEGPKEIHTADSSADRTDGDNSGNTAGVDTLTNGSHASPPYGSIPGAEPTPPPEPSPTGATEYPKIKIKTTGLFKDPEPRGCTITEITDDNPTGDPNLSNNHPAPIWTTPSLEDPLKLPDGDDSQLLNLFNNNDRAKDLGFSTSNDNEFISLDTYNERNSRGAMQLYNPNPASSSLESLTGLPMQALAQQVSRLQPGGAAGQGLHQQNVLINIQQFPTQPQPQYPQQHQPMYPHYPPHPGQPPMHNYGYQPPSHVYPYPPAPGYPPQPPGPHMPHPPPQHQMGQMPHPPPMGQQPPMGGPGQQQMGGPGQPPPNSMENNMVKLTPRLRIELIEHHEKTGGTLLSTARKYNVTITAVHNILKNKSAVVKRYNEGKDGRSKRFSLSEHAVLDSEVVKWYAKQESGKNFGGVTKWELRRIVNSVAKEYKIDFQITSAWLKEFAAKNGVVVKVVARNSDVGKTTVFSKKTGTFVKGTLQKNCEKLKLKLKNADINRKRKNKDATVEESATSKIFLDQDKVGKIDNTERRKLPTNTDATKGLNVNLKGTKKKHSGVSNLDQIDEKIDNLKNRSKEKQFLKLGHIPSNLKIINDIQASLAIKNRPARPKSLKKDVDVKEILSKPSDNASDKRSTQEQSKISDVRKDVKDDLRLANGPVINPIKRNKVGRPRINPVSDKTIPTKSFYSLISRTALGAARLKAKSGTDDPDNIKLKPKEDPDASHTSQSDYVVIKVDDNNEDSVIKRKVGRPKRSTLTPKNSDIKKAVDNNLNPARKSRSGCLEIVGIDQEDLVTGDRNKPKVGRPRKTISKPGMNKNVSMTRKNTLKQSLKLKVTRLTSKGQWKVKIETTREKRKDERKISKKYNKISKIDKGTVINNNKSGLNNNDTIIKQEGGDKWRDVFEFKDETEDARILPIKRKRKTIIDLKPKKIVPIKQCNSTQEGMGAKRVCSRSAKLNVTSIFEVKGQQISSSRDDGKIYIKDNIKTANDEVPKNRRIKSSNIDIFEADVKPSFEHLEFTPKNPRAMSSSFLKDQCPCHRSNRRSTRNNIQSSTTSVDSEKNMAPCQKIISSNSCTACICKEQDEGLERVADVMDTIVTKTGDFENNDDDNEYFNDYSYEYENFEGDNVDLDDTDYCVAVENGNVVEITVDKFKEIDEEQSVNVKDKKVFDEKPNTPKIDIISDIMISGGSKTIMKRNTRSTSSSYVLLSNGAEQMTESLAPSSTRTMETQTSRPSSPIEQDEPTLDESWSNLFPELESDLSADELVTKINEIEFQYDSDPFKDVKIQVHSGYEAEEEESYEYEDYEYEDDDGPSSQGQPMPPPNQMQQPPNNMQNGYRPPMPPTGRAPAPRGPQPGIPRMPGGPRGPQMNQRAPGARPRAPMVRPRGAGATPVRGQMRPRMSGPQNGIRPSNQTSPAKRTPEQNNAMQAKRKKLDVLTPSDKDDDDCQVICMQPKNTDGGLPQIESVQGAESVENSIMHLSDSITLSVRNPPPKPVASPVKSDAKAVANILATRGITVTASAKSKESSSPIKQAPALPQALSLNGAVSIVASKNASPAKPATEALPTVDLTDDTQATGSPPKNRPGLPYRCDLCPAQYPNAMGLNKHRQAYHKTTSGMCELGVPLINIKQPGIMQKLSQMGINNYIPLPSAGPEGTYALPIISTKNPGNMANIGATQMLSLGPVRAIPRTGVANTANVKK